MAMLTIKNRAHLCLLAALILTACAPPGPRALIEGKKRLDRGHYQQAIAKFEDATSILRTNAQAWNYLGLAYHHAGRPDEALQAYNRALSLDRSFSEARYNLGCLQLEMNRPDQAKSTFTTLTLERDQHLDGYLKLGTAASRSGDLTTAERAFNNALRFSPENPEALTGLGVVRQKRGRSADAADFFARALKADPQYAPALINYAAVAQHSLKDRHLALRLYNQYLSLKPLPSNSGPVVVAATDLQRELARLAASPKTTPQQTRLPGTTSSASRQTNDAAIAQPGFVKSNLAPTPPPKPPQKSPYVPPLAATNNTTQPVAQAPTQTKTAQADAPNPPKTGTRSFISRIFGSGKSSNTTSASSPGPHANSMTPAPRVKGYAYENPAKPAPGNRTEADRLFHQALVARQAFRVTDALKLYQQATRADPSFFNAQFNLAVTLAELGDLQNAADAYERALAIQPGSFDARFNFALLLKQMGYAAETVRELEKLTKSHPADARAHVMLGNIYSQQLKRNDKARECYTRAIQADPNTPQAAAIRQWLADPRN